MDSHESVELERRTEDRKTDNRYYSVELTPSGALSSYHFKLRNVSSKGLCILVREDSSALKRLRVGQLLKIQLYLEGDPKPVEGAMATVRHMTPHQEGRYRGHVLVGLSLQDEQPSQR